MILQRLSSLFSPDMFKDQIETSGKHGLLQRAGKDVSLLFCELEVLVMAETSTLTTHSRKGLTCSSRTENFFLEESAVILSTKWTNMARLTFIGDE